MANYLDKYFKDNSKEIFLTLKLAFSNNFNIDEKINCQKVIFFSNKFGLSPRIGWKIEKENPPIIESLKEYFSNCYRETAKKNLLCLNLCSMICKICRDIEIPLIFLKGSSLLLEGKTKTGSRNLADVDVLVPSDRARELYSYIKKEGFYSSEEKYKEENHLPPLYSRWGVLEIHTKIPFLKLKKEKNFIDFEGIIKLEGFKKILFEEGDYLILSRPLFFTHLIVHSFFQHYYFLDYYNPFQGLLDLQDMDISETEKDEFYDFIYSNFEYPLESYFIDNIFDLLVFLKEGKEENLDLLVKNSRKIFFHLIWGCLDKEYVYAMRLRGIKSKYYFKNIIIKYIFIFKELMFYSLREIITRGPGSVFHLIRKLMRFSYAQLYLIFKRSNH